MGTTEVSGASREPSRFRWAFTFSVDGDLRFISHHDTLRLFRRALSRASLPVRYSEGFNPHPRIMIPLPCPVGIASNVEAIVVETDGPIDPDDALCRLESHTPPGVRMLAVRPLGLSERLVPVLVRYRIEPSEPPIEDLPQRTAQLLAADVVSVERRNRKKSRTETLDIRPYIETLCVEDGAVEMVLRVTGSGTAKPSEVAGLLGYDAESVNHRIRRMEIQWR